MVLVIKNLTANSGDRTRGFHPWVQKIPWRRAWQPIPVFMSEESHGQKRWVGYGPYIHKESNMTEVT